MRPARFLAIAALTTGCGPADHYVLDPCTTSTFFFDAGRFENMLKGDTTRWTVVGTCGNDVARWNSSGSAAAFAVGNGTTSAIGIASASVIIKGLSPGISMITATSAAEALVVRQELRVADSSVIASVYFVDAQVAMQPLSSRVLQPLLRDAAGAYFAGAPTTYSTSNAAVASVAMQQVGQKTLPVLRAHSAGQATITATFRQAQGTVQVTVAP